MKPDASDKLNILLVDDQQAKLLSHEVVLAEIGETLLQARSAREALECLLRNEIALILIDVCMPELDGFELAELIREHPRYERTAIIFVSAVMNGSVDQLRGYKLGAVDYVPVPVVPELLRAKVRVFLDLYRKTRQLERFNAELEQRVAERTMALARFNEKLEARIEERTRERETALAQLFEAQKMDTIGRLTGGVAHDFNNLLMAVLGSLALLEKRLPDDPQGHRFLQNAILGAQRGAALTQRLLAFSRRQELKPESVDVIQLFAGMEELLARALGLGIELRLQFAESLPPVLVDAHQLELALLNLALNARDAMPNGGALNITAQTMPDIGGADAALQAGKYVRLLIVDTGVGMDEMTLSKATEPFFTTKEIGKGTGLGLSMVHGLAAQSGGLLRLASTPNVGTTIELWLPRSNTSPRPIDSQQKHLRPPSLQRSCRVLIVDDDALVLTGTAALIEDLGHAPIEARSGAEALASLETSGDIDLVITDHGMPVMTGLQLSKCIRERHPGIPIILATGYAELPSDPASLGLFKIAKPYSQSEIAMTIQSALDAGFSSPVLNPANGPD